MPKICSLKIILRQATNKYFVTITVPLSFQITFPRNIGGVISVVFTKVFCLLFKPKITINHKVFRCQYICFRPFHTNDLLVKDKMDSRFYEPIHLQFKFLQVEGEFGRLTYSPLQIFSSFHLANTILKFYDSWSVANCASLESYTIFCVR